MNDLIINENGIESYIYKKNIAGFSVCIIDDKERIEGIYGYLIKNKKPVEWESLMPKFFLNGYEIEYEILQKDPHYQYKVNRAEKVNIWKFDNRNLIQQRINKHARDYLDWLENELKEEESIRQAKIKAREDEQKAWQEEHGKRSFWGKIKHYFE